MIGDTTHDLQMALNAGCASVGVSYGAHEPDEFEALQPLFVAHSVARPARLAAGKRLKSRMRRSIPLCNSADLVDGGAGRALRRGATAARPAAPSRSASKARSHAYLNRCAHVAMELDWQPDRFFDDSGRWLLCATHGAVYQPDTGECAGGPCRGGLVKIALSEQRRRGALAYCLEPQTRRVLK